jgi:putative oxidoreductase
LLSALLAHRLDVALLWLRLIIGVVFVAHGAQKLFGAFGGAGLDGTADFMRDLGLDPGMFFAVSAGLSEFCGGLLLLAGLLTPLGALAITGVMAVAIATVNGENGFFNQDQGYEYNLVLTGIALALIVAGPGRYSLDRVLGVGYLPPRLRARDQRKIDSGSIGPNFQSK